MWQNDFKKNLPVESNDTWHFPGFGILMFCLTQEFNKFISTRHDAKFISFSLECNINILLEIYDLWAIIISIGF